MEILVGESVFLYIWRGNGIPHLFLSNNPAWQQQFLDKSSAQHKIKCFLIDHYSAVSNKFFSTYCTVFLKLRYCDIVTFRTKNWIDENLVVGKLQISRFPLWHGKILSDHFECPCDAISIIIAFEFLACLSVRVPQTFFSGEGKLCLFSK